MEWVETTGRTLAEAKEAALDELGVDETDAEFEVLEEPRSGLFGRLRGEARVRARVKPSVPRQKIDRRRDRRRRTRGREDRPRGARNGGTGGSTATAVVDTENDDNDENDDEEAAMEAPTVPAAEQAEMAREFIEGMLGAFGFSGAVSASAIDEDTVEVAVTGDDLGILVGPKGQTLAALQELARTAVQRRVPGRTARLHVDVAGYREKRRAALERFTQQVAQAVLESGTRRALEPMSAVDRKVVHDAANLIEGVRTVSEGEDPNRRVVIVPDSDDSPRSNPALTDALGESQRLGFIGPGAIEEHLAHAAAFAGAVRDLPGIRRALDLGSGGGIPGLVLAEHWPAIEWVLLDSNERRALFVDATVQALGWSHVRVVRARAEEAGRRPDHRGKFDLVVSRSFGPPPVTAECAAGFLRTGGHLVVSEPPVAADDRWPAEGLAELGFGSATLLAGPPRFALLEMTGVCPERYPRRVGIPSKRPLWECST